MTSYMFDPKLPLFVRGLSSFHGWLPFLCYGPSGGWVTIAGPSLAGRSSRASSSWPRSPLLWLPPLGEQPQLGRQPQLRSRTQLRDAADRDAPAPRLGIMLVGFPLVFYLPAHLALLRGFPRRGCGTPRGCWIVS